MGDKIEATSDLPENQGKAGTDDVTGNHKTPVDRGAGGVTPAIDPTSDDSESSEANPGSRQEQAGMRS